MHKYNIYGSWEDTYSFWNNKLINCSLNKKLKNNNKKDLKHVRNESEILSRGNIHKLNESNRFARSNEKNSRKK